MLMMAAATALFWKRWSWLRWRGVPANAAVEPLTWEDLRKDRQELGPDSDRLPCSCPHCRQQRRAG